MSFVRNFPNIRFIDSSHARRDAFPKDIDVFYDGFRNCAKFLAYRPRETTCIFFDYLGNVIAPCLSATISWNLRSLVLSLSHTLAYAITTMHTHTYMYISSRCSVCMYHCSENTSRAALPFTKFLPFIGTDTPLRPRPRLRLTPRSFAARYSAKLRDLWSLPHSD